MKSIENEPIYLRDIKKKSLKELSQLCQQFGISSGQSRNMITLEIIKYCLKNEIKFIYQGFLEVVNGYGFLRDISNNFLQTPYDVYVSVKIIKEMDLRMGDEIECLLGEPKNEDQKFFSCLQIQKVNAKTPGYKRPVFEDLTPCYPREQIILECADIDPKNNVICRVIDLICPIGFGQRALIVAPPKVGKTTFIQSLAISIIKNYPEAKLIILLIDERPEEVTEMKKIAPDAEIIYSTFDEQPENHVKTTEIALERARRLTENKQDKVVVLMDSITRLVRAYNSVVPSSGRVLTGGIEPAAIHKPKRFFGSARNTQEGGSLTIVATCLVETGSRMDDIIFEEFKSAGNCDIKLERKIAESRIYPAIDIRGSSTRKAEDMIAKDTFLRMRLIERHLADFDVLEAIKTLLERIQFTSTNKDLIFNMQKR